MDKEIRADGEVVTVKQPLPMPEGVSDAAVGGTPTSYSAVGRMQTFSSERKSLKYASKPKPMPKGKPKPSPRPKEEKMDKIFQVVETMPRFPGCEDNGGTDAEKKTCADKKMLEFIYQNLIYPESAQENGIEGVVIVSFVIKKDGSIADVKIIRSIEKGCDEEAVRLVKMMPKWIPGKQRGQAVDVQFNLPIRFRLTE